MTSIVTGPSGWLVIDKPMGISSARVVGAARRALGTRKIGHGGTLDPLASGVLPLAVGEATKTVAYAMAGEKIYRFTVRWGEARATDDAEGEVTATADHRPAAEDIQRVLPQFTGAIDQVPPDYSAIKIAGQRAYKLARQAKPVALKPRTVVVNSLVLLGIPDRDQAEFEVTGGKGLYVRALGRDLARALGTVGYIAALRRTKVGPFRIEAAISLDKLEDLGHSPALLECLLPVETALDDIPALALTEPEAARLKLGQPLRALRTGSPASRPLPDGAVACATAAGKPVALVRLDGDLLRPVRVLNL
jgi:tRNA pseudouridine55 synthase